MGPDGDDTAVKHYVLQGSHTQKGSWFQSRHFPEYACAQDPERGES